MKIKINETDVVTQCVIGILTAVPNEISPSILIKSLTSALGIALAGTSKDIYDDKMYEDLVDVVKGFAQRKGAREIFNHIFRAEEL